MWGLLCVHVHTCIKLSAILHTYVHMLDSSVCWIFWNFKTDPALYWSYYKVFYNFYDTYKMFSLKIPVVFAKHFIKSVFHLFTYICKCSYKFNCNIIFMGYILCFISIKILRKRNKLILLWFFITLSPLRVIEKFVEKKFSKIQLSLQSQSVYCIIFNLYQSFICLKIIEKSF